MEETISLKVKWGMFYIETGLYTINLAREKKSGVHARQRLEDHQKFSRSPRCLTVVQLALFSLSATPISSFGSEKPGPGPAIPAPQMYRKLKMDEVPTIINHDVESSNDWHVRYGC